MLCPWGTPSFRGTVADPLYYNPILKCRIVCQRDGKKTKKAAPEIPT